MTHIRMIAERVADDTGAEQQVAYTACRVALEAIPTPAAGTKWDYTNVPADLVDRVAADARAALDRTAEGGTMTALQPLEHAQSELEGALEAVEQARAVRDDAMRAARAAGVPIAALQKVTGLSRGRTAAICAM